MMKIIAITDIHGRYDNLSKLANEMREVDVVLLCGDVTNFGTALEAKTIIDVIKRFNENVLVVPGNCDPMDVGEYMVDAGISLHERLVLINGVCFVGVGGSVPCPSRTPNEVGEQQLAASLRKSVESMKPGRPLVLVSHQPACLTAVDIAGGSRHVGSQAIRDFIEEYEPILAFSGHIHESVGVDYIGKTRLVNPGPLVCGGYARATVGETVEELEICQI